MESLSGHAFGENLTLNDFVARFPRKHLEPCKDLATFWAGHGLFRIIFGYAM